VLGASVLGCGAQFDPGSELHGLRVLALKKSAPYAQPGTRVDLQLLWHDTEPDRPPPQIAWLAACQNPPGDLFDACFATAPQAGGGDLIEQLRTRSSLPDPSSAQANDHFSFETSPDIISSRPPPKDPTTVPYGLDYVLFAVCAGTLDLRLDRDFPFVCYLEQDGEPGLSSGDAELGSSDFIVGYTSVFAYDAIENQNPLVYGLRWGELELRPGELPMMAGEPLAAAALGADDLCIGAACQPAPASAEPGVCPEALTIDACPGSSPCDKLRFGPIVDPASAELYTAASAHPSTELQEQNSVKYYASDAELSQEVKLLNDATQGWNEESDTEFRAGKEAGVTYLWSVAHDNRGGAEWARLRVCTR
jgi:hypothetical protein